MIGKKVKRICLFSMALLLSASFAASGTEYPVFADPGEVSAVSNASEGDEKLVDSGIDYTETTDTLDQPGVGYTQTIWITCRPGDTPVRVPTGNIVLMFINIGAFSSGSNGTKNDDGTYTPGTDYDLDETFFSSLRQTFENGRKNGCMMAVRFRYDELGNDDPEPASFEKVLDHVRQIKESRIFDDYEDILAFVESGFAGKWGEQHGGKYTSVEYKAQLLDAMLDCVPKSVPVTVRTADTFAKWAGIERKELGSFYSEDGSDAARVGMYNDGYLGSDSDLGTFADRTNETDWINHQMLNTYYGGEFSGNIDFAKTFDNYLPENAIPEMYKTHLSYINGNIFSLYKDYEFGEKYDPKLCDNTAYYGQTVFKFIRDHLGYRFVLRDSKLSGDTVSGGELKLKFRVENTGFSNPHFAFSSEILLEHEGEYYKVPTDIDPSEWCTGETDDITLNIQLPSCFEEGKWNVYLRMNAGNTCEEEATLRTVTFANKNIRNDVLGANFLGSFNITENSPESQKCELYVLGTDGKKIYSDGTKYSARGMHITDGILSDDYEWSEDMCIFTDSDGHKVWLDSDEKNLYIRTDLVAGDAEKPVYNLQIRNHADGKNYWIYWESSGFIYFNGKDYSGAGYASKEFTEYRIPLGEMMNISGGSELDSVRIFIQDASVPGWSTVNTIQTPGYAVPDKTILKGDVSTDQTVSAADVIKLTNILLGREMMTYSEKKAGDMNEDGLISVMDLILLKSMLLN